MSYLHKLIVFTLISGYPLLCVFIKNQWVIWRYSQLLAFSSTQITIRDLTLQVLIMVRSNPEWRLCLFRFNPPGQNCGGTSN